jgi:hypothetical protein
LHDGRYETSMGSDVARDGLFLELWDRPSNELALWAFFSMDAIFDVRNFRNEIIWKRTSSHSDERQGTRHYGRITDTILLARE